MRWVWYTSNIIIVFLLSLMRHNISFFVFNDALLFSLLSTKFYYLYHYHCFRTLLYNFLFDILKTRLKINLCVLILARTETDFIHRTKENYKWRAGEIRLAHLGIPATIYLSIVIAHLGKQLAIYILEKLRDQNHK